MSIAATHRARQVTASDVATGKSKDRTTASLVFLLALWFSLFFGIMVLVALIIDTAIEGASRFDMQPAHRTTLDRAAPSRPASGPASSAACG